LKGKEKTPIQFVIKKNECTRRTMKKKIKDKEKERKKMRICKNSLEAFLKERE
jgi:hypothetical protein